MGFEGEGCYILVLDNRILQLQVLWNAVGIHTLSGELRNFETMASTHPLAPAVKAKRGMSQPQDVTALRRKAVTVAYGRQLQTEKGSGDRSNFGSEHPVFEDEVWLSPFGARCTSLNQILLATFRNLSEVCFTCQGTQTCVFDFDRNKLQVCNCFPIPCKNRELTRTAFLVWVYVLFLTLQ